MPIVAMLTMLIDHIGLIFFPNELLWRIIGRLAFPIYLFGIVQGWKYTRNRKRYVIRLSVIGAVSQIPFVLSVGAGGINVIGTFLMILAAFWVLDRMRGNGLAIVSVVLIALALEMFPFDYGAYGLGLALCYRYLSGFNMVAAHMAMNLLWMFYKGWGIQLYSILPTVLFAFGPDLMNRMNRFKVPRWLWLSFYPAHLLILGIILHGGQIAELWNGR